MREEKDRQQVRIDELEGIAGNLVGESDEASMRHDAEIEELEERAKKAEELAEALKLDKSAVDATVKKAEKEACEAKDKLKKAEERADGEKKKAEEAARRADEAEKKAKLEKVIEVVEVVPAGMEDELVQLRTKLRTAPNEQVIRIRDSYDRMIAEFEAILGALDEVEPDEAARYRSAFRRGLGTMIEKLGG